MISLASCRLTVAGQTIADTASAVGIRPVALAGAQIQWGREDMLTQPRASTATVRLALPKDPGNWPNMLTIGRTLTLSAAIPVTTPGTPTALDLTLATATGGTLTGTVLDPDGDSEAIVWIPPAAPSTRPGAWDHLPTMAPGQTWTLRTTVNVSLAPSTATLHVAYYSSPFARPVLGPALDTRRGQVLGTTLTGTLTTGQEHAGSWIGLAVRMWPTGTHWRERTMAWSSTHDWTWRGAGSLTLKGATIAPPAKAGDREAEVFTGRITDTALTWDEHTNAPVLTLTAADMLAELAQIRTGALPWAEHTLAQRLDAILTSANVDVPVVIDPVPAQAHLAPVDVDAQPVANLLTEAVSSTGAILWCTAHSSTGTYLRVEDATTRLALGRLTIPASGPATVTPSLSAGYELHAQHLKRDVTLARATAQRATVVRVTWIELTPSEDGQGLTQTQRAVTITDAAAIAAAGHREVSVQTSLVRSDDAEMIASRLAAVTMSDAWALDSLTWDTTLNAASADTATLAALLDSTSRMGAPLRITGLPAWVPGHPTRTAYVEGGTWTWDGAAWTLQMNLASATATGSGLTWRATPKPLTWERSGSITWAHTAQIDA